MHFTETVYRNPYPCAFRKLSVETDHGTDFHSATSDIQISNMEIFSSGQHFFIIKSTNMDLGIMEDFFPRPVKDNNGISSIAGFSFITQ